ncbi:MAG: efflux RND transporter periplasmic adaptor subunit [Spirochaetaceae bacterium]|nr:efflux RND transporter periplasmic adaptor subunit [Spirochaetaceae bacterium]
MKLCKLIFVSIITVFIFSACTNPAEQSPADNASVQESSSGAAVVDLSSPPPGSNADQAKWDTFDDAKKQGSWDKYVSDNTASSDNTAEASAEEAPVERTPGSGGGGGGGSSIIPVTVGELTKAPMNIYYYGLGELKAGEEIRIAPGSTGTVASLYVSEGDFVEPGDLLFSLDNNDLVKNIERSSEKWNNDLNLASIKLSEATANYETTSSLYSKELIAKSEFDKAQQSWEEAELNYEKIQLAKTIEIENLQENLRTTVAISTGRGYISNITFNKGELVNSGDYVEIIDIEKIAITVQVPENIITRIKQGQQVVAKQASAPAYVLEGSVTSMGLKADSNRTYEVIAEFDNPNQKLLPGMLMEAQIQMVQYSPNFIVPKESLIIEGPDQFVFIIKDGVAEKIPVEVGQSRGILIQINGSIKERDLLVLKGQTYLQKGAAVNVVETKKYLPESTEF